MREWFIAIAEPVVVAIDTLAMLVIVIGTIEVAIHGLRAALPSANGQEIRLVWLRYARWLVAGLSIQLAADIVESSIAIDWTSVGRLAAIAVIRTFLNYFLERDLAELRERQDASPEFTSEELRKRQ